MGRLRVVLVRLFSCCFHYTNIRWNLSSAHTHVPSKQMLMHFFPTFNLFYFSPRDVFTTHEANLREEDQWIVVAYVVFVFVLCRSCYFSRYGNFFFRREYLHWLALVRLARTKGGQSMERKNNFIEWLFRKNKKNSCECARRPTTGQEEFKKLTIGACGCELVGGSVCVEKFRC